MWSACKVDYMLCFVFCIQRDSPIGQVCIFVRRFSLISRHESSHTLSLTQFKIWWSCWVTVLYTVLLFCLSSNMDYLNFEKKFTCLCFLLKYRVSATTNCTIIWVQQIYIQNDLIRIIYNLSNKTHILINRMC